MKIGQIRVNLSQVINIQCHNSWKWQGIAESGTPLTVRIFCSGTIDKNIGLELKPSIKI